MAAARNAPPLPTCISSRILFRAGQLGIIHGPFQLPSVSRTAGRYGGWRKTGCLPGARSKNMVGHSPRDGQNPREWELRL